MPNKRFRTIFALWAALVIASGSWASATRADVGDFGVGHTPKIQVLPHDKGYLMVFEVLQLSAKPTNTVVYFFDKESVTDVTAPPPDPAVTAGITEELLESSGRLLKRLDGSFETVTVVNGEFHIYRKVNHSVFSLDVHHKTQPLKHIRTVEHNLPLTPFVVDITGADEASMTQAWGHGPSSLGRFTLQGNSWIGQTYHEPGMKDMHWRVLHRIGETTYLFVPTQAGKLAVYAYAEGKLETKGELDIAVERFALWGQTPNIIYLPKLIQQGATQDKLIVAKVDLEAMTLTDSRQLSVKPAKMQFATLLAANGTDEDGFIVYSVPTGEAKLWRGPFSALGSTPLAVKDLGIAADVVEQFGYMLVLTGVIMAFLVIVTRMRMARNTNGVSIGAGRILPRRALALLVDLYLEFGLVFLVVHHGGIAGQSASLEEMFKLMEVTLAIGVPVYFFVMEGMTGTTIGKRLLGLRVIHANGMPLTWRGALLRNLMRIVDFLPVAIFPLVGIIALIFNQGIQRLGDIVAQTRVVDVQVIEMLHGKGGQVDEQA